MGNLYHSITWGSLNCQALRPLLAFAGRLIENRLDDIGDRLGIDLALLGARSFSASAAAAVSAHSLKVVISPTISASDRQRWVGLSEKRTLGNASPYWTLLVPVHIVYDI